MNFKTPKSHDWDFLLSYFFSYFFLFFFSLRRDIKKVHAVLKKLLCKKNILTICWRPFYETSRRLIACIISGIPGLSLIPSHSLPFTQTNQELCRPSTPVTDNGFLPIEGPAPENGWTSSLLCSYTVLRENLQCVWEIKGYTRKRTQCKEPTLSMEVAFFLLLEFAISSREVLLDVAWIKLCCCKTKLSKWEKENYLNCF